MFQNVMILLISAYATCMISNFATICVSKIYLIKKAKENSREHCLILNIFVCTVFSCLSNEVPAPITLSLQVGTCHLLITIANHLEPDQTAGDQNSTHQLVITSESRTDKYFLLKEVILHIHITPLYVLYCIRF